MAIDFTKYPNKISNCGYDENKKVKGGQAGDQTGHEWQIKNWYNRPWTCVLRYPDQKVRELIAELAIEAANNNKIGYDQSQRMTYWKELQKANYRPKNIKTACEADCSAGVIANTKAVGHLLGIPKLENIQASYTRNMRDGYKAAGFQVLTESKYIKDSSYLVPGDILLYDGHHTATNICIGNKVKYTPYKEEQVTPTKGKNETSTETKQIQTMLNTIGDYKLKVDNKYGPLTTAAVKDFQSKNNITPSGDMNIATLTKLKTLYKEAITITIPINPLNKNYSVLSNYNKVPAYEGIVIASSSLNVRKGPAKTSYVVITKLLKNQTVQICDAVKNPVGALWYLIKIKDGYGFVDANYINVTKKL